LRAADQLTNLRWRVGLATIPGALAVSSDSETIAVSVGTSANLYAAADGQLLGTIPGLAATIGDLAIAPDGRLLALAQADALVSLWDLAERSLLSELRLPVADGDFLVPGAFTSVAFSPDGQYIAAGDDSGNVGVWALVDGVAIQTLSVGARVVADVAFSPDSRLVAAASEGWRSEPGAIWVWDVASGAESHWLSRSDDEHQLVPAQRLAFSPDGAHVLMGLADGGLLRWRLADGALEQELSGHRAALTALAVAPDGGALSAARDGSLRTWHADGSPAEALADTGAIAALAISPDGGLLAAGDEGGRIDLRRRDGTLLSQIPAQGGAISALALSPDAQTLAAAAADGTIRLYDAPGGQARGELRGHGGPALALAFSPDGARLASGGQDGTLRLWRPQSQAVERVAPVLQTDGISATSLYQIAFSPDGQLIAVVGSEGAVSLWRSADLTQVERWPIPEADPALQVAFTPSGGLVVRTYDGRLYAWIGSTVAMPVLGSGVSSVAVLGDDQLITISGGAFYVWRGPLAAPAPYAQAPAPGFNRVVFASGTIALASDLGFVEVWGLK
ncbi:MAG: hypothetical protein HGA65_15205, partial [Oscillochloris sp.]|nr:hypothetical protein [Oscillochloris sp.]